MDTEHPELGLLLNRGIAIDTCRHLLESIDQIDEG